MAVVRFAAVLGVVAVLASLALSCGSEGADPELVSRGRELFSEQGCTACHGRAGEGGRAAPPLAGVHRHWKSEELVQFLAHPRDFRQKNRRLRRLAERYPAEMPSFAAAGEERLRALAAYALSL
jgi:mono/diheme cytochrome c family protein